jgi:multidrug efflux pump
MMFITMKPPEQRKRTQQEFAAVMRKELGDYPGLRAVVMDMSQAGFGGGRGFPIEFAIQGPEFEQLVATSDEVMDKLRASGSVVDLDRNYDLGMPELGIIPDRARAADLGVSIEDVAATVGALVGGMRVGKYSSGGRRVDVRMKLLAGQRSRPSDLGRLRVRNRDGELIPLSTLVRTEEKPTLQAITRRDRERAITHYANIAPGHSQDQVVAALAQIGKELPQGYRLVNVGQSMQFKETMSGLIFALLLGILVSYMVLASQFNSLVHPITVLTILPLSAAGAAFALWASGGSINMFSMIGLLLLMGIAKKNSIILVDYANQLREAGKDSLAAMTEAGPTRLRPILMTSVATVMAAVPAALSLGPGGEIRAPMAVAVIGGMVLSTALSLFVVPAFYVVVDRAILRVRGMFGSRAKAEPPVVEAEQRQAG